MGPYRAAALSLLFCAPVLAQTPGWHYSPLPGEGDRAAMGCDRDAVPSSFACLVVRCDDDFSAGIYLYSSRSPDALGLWDFTVDREDRSFAVVEGGAPYSGRIEKDRDWLLERLQQGSYVYLRHAQDSEDAFRFVSLAGSLAAIGEALYWCAPRVPPIEQNALPDVEPEIETGEDP